MVVRTARVSWVRDEHGGGGEIKGESGALETRYSFGSRFESAPGSNPEELLGAAHAACFNLALAGALRRAGHVLERLETAAEVTLEKEGEGYHIKSVRLSTVGEAEGLEAKEFEELAHRTKLGCPISKALAGTDIFLEAKLL